MIDLTRNTIEFSINDDYICYKLMNIFLNCDALVQ